ncbi:MAG TPA: iron uptake transporter deferrochelatase/peroxidase subunit [Solirubrobacteraceae bacterium]|jgi:deferrochelatase/peroxidase EfeB|nr:iron uptake transporter deferrochelatase/peroxidase subunit [Solirubrobacteraceae bacterium]
MMDGEDRGARKGFTRRGVISSAALLGVGAGLDHVLRGSARSAAAPAAGPGPTEDFYGSHQAGIATPAQDYLHFAAFDVTSDAADDLRGVLEQWSAAAARLTAGRVYEPVAQTENEPPVDTGEAVGLSPSRLTITIGMGPTLFGSAGTDRFGLSHLRPSELVPLPQFQGEDLDPSSSGGDLCVQACANDPQVAFHAIHVLSRVAASAAALRYTQAGFGRTSSTTRTQQTPRNLMGFRDGTDNIRAEDTQAMNDFVWVQDGDEPAWMAGGSYLIARRIKILFDVWDATTLEDQQRVIGRNKLSGAPLGGEGEYSPVDLKATAANGELVIPADAHIRVAGPHANQGQRILRRGYSYSESVEPGSGQIDAGLFFIAFQRSPSSQFIPIQRRLAASDALNKHTLHTSSAIFACPPGAQPGGFVGQELFS